MDKLTVIGIDPPVSKNCGWSVLSLENNKVTLSEKFTQVLDHPKDTLTGLDQGLEDVYQMMYHLILAHQAKIVCMERQLGGGFQFGRAKLNEFVGVIKLCCLRNHVKVVEVSPAHLKMVIAGHGKAPKEYIMENIVKTFNLSEAGAEHECDAAAFALTYFLDNGWTGYQIAKPFTSELFKAEKDAKAARKKLREQRKKLKEQGLIEPKKASKKKQKV